MSIFEGNPSCGGSCAALSDLISEVDEDRYAGSSAMLLPVGVTVQQRYLTCTGNFRTLVSCDDPCSLDILLDILYHVRHNHRFRPQLAATGRFGADSIWPCSWISTVSSLDFSPSATAPIMRSYFGVIGHNVRLISQLPQCI